jgi:hypothetical protein
MKKIQYNYVYVFIGLMLLGVGLDLAKSVGDPQGFMRALPYVLIGIGCGMFGQGVGNAVTAKTMENQPELQKQQEIEQNDERNIEIGNRAKAKAYDMMIFVFGALMLSFALMGVDFIAILLLVGSYLFIVGYGIYFRCKFNKEM